MKKGKEMSRSMAGLMFVAMVAAGLFSSCTIMERLRQLSPGEIQLTRLQAPEVVQEGISYEGILSYRSESTPTVKRVCCRWIAENPTVKNASMYWYNLEVAGDKEPGSEGTKWIDQGPVRDFSNIFCLAGIDPRAVGVDTITFRFTARGIKESYNRMECYAETSVEGALRETNRVSAPVNRGDR